MKLNDIHNAVLVWGCVAKKQIAQLKAEPLVIVPEMRPFCIGIRYVLPLFDKEDIRAVYCTDNMLGILLYKQKIKKTLLFCSNTTDKKGPSGTTYVALLSKIHGIPVEIYTAQRYDFKAHDTSAATLSGHNFLLEETLKEYIISPECETIDEEVIKNEV